jgi:general secretion pathway protein D
MAVIRKVSTAAFTVMCVSLSRQLHAQEDTTDAAQPDSITIQLVDVDLRHAVQALARYLDHPVVFGELTSSRVTVETPTPVGRSQVVGLLRGLLAGQDYELTLDSTGVYRVVALETDEIESRVNRRGDEQEPPELFVLQLSHARADDVAATVNALYGQASALGELGEPTATLSERLQQDRVPPVGTPPQAVASVAGRAATLAGEVTIVPDAGTNSLLVRAGRSDFELIEAVVQQLDVRPLQVLIEVLIVEARRDRSFALGLAVELEETEVGDEGTTVSGFNRGLGLGDLVLNVMKVGGVKLHATLEAASARGDVSIVSRPVLIVANNDQAEIDVGEQRPFVQVSRSLPTDVPQRDQVVQYKDVGTKLSVRPTLSGDGYVMLQVVQQVNAATNETAFNAPVISTRSVDTQLLIKDGQTIVLGGLTDRTRVVSKSGIPVLSEIPIVGGLFGQQSRQTLETELFVFLTPHVIRTDEEAEDVTAPLLERAEKGRP